MGPDPRDMITPEAFSVAPELLGIPLARPWRRGAAMAIDLLIIAIITGLGLSWLLLFVAITILAGRATVRKSNTRLREGARHAIFGSLAIVAFIAALIAGYELIGDVDLPARFTAGGDGGAGQPVTGEMGIMGAVATARDVAAIKKAETPVELREAVDRLAADLAGLGLQPDTINQVLVALADESDEAWAKEVILGATDAELASRAAARRAAVDSLAIVYADALRAGDSTAVGVLRQPLGEALAADRIAELTSQRDALAERVDDEENRGLISLILQFLNEVGIDIGWSALFFTLFPAVWMGRTPGKRLMGIRIVRLDGKPIGWWAALNRFGGYAASIFTGLLGFFEMFWDENRQALQDRIASTVVIRELKGVAAAGPAKP